MPKIIKYDEFDDVNSEERKIIAERLKRIRSINQLTQEDFAEELNCSVDKIKKIESKKQKLDIDLALSIHNLFEVSLDYIYGINDYENLDDYLIDDLLEEVLEPKIFTKKYLSKDMIQLQIDTLQIKVKKGFIPCIIELIKLREQLNNKKISYDEFNDKRESLLKNFKYASKNTDYEYHIIVPKILLDEKNMFQIKKIAEDMQKAYDLQFNDMKKED